MKLSEKVAALMGFMEGKEIDATTVEGQIFTKIAEILRDMSYEIEDLETRCDDLRDYCDELDSDLGDVEEYLLDELDDEDDEDDDDYYPSGRSYDDDYDGAFYDPYSSRSPGICRGCPSAGGCNACFH